MLNSQLPIFGSSTAFLFACQNNYTQIAQRIITNSKSVSYPMYAFAVLYNYPHIAEQIKNKLDNFSSEMAQSVTEFYRERNAKGQINE